MIKYIYNPFFYFFFKNGKIQYHAVLGGGPFNGDTQTVGVTMEGLAFSMVINYIVGGIKLKIF